MDSRSYLVVGATGATGRLLVQQLLERGQLVRVIVRSTSRLPEAVREHPRLSITEANLLELDDAALARHVDGVSGVASCLGHTLSFGGIALPPWRLVTDAVRRVSRALRASPPSAPTRPTRFVLMNTTGVRNRDLAEPTSLAQRAVIGLIRLCLPPHADNENAADALRVGIGQGDPQVEWAAVRPDGLVNTDAPSAYDVHPSPTRSAIFDAGTTSRANVAHFMAELLTDDATWSRWQGQMPVIYNREP